MFYILRFGFDFEDSSRNIIYFLSYRACVSNLEILYPFLRFGSKNITDYFDIWPKVYKRDMTILDNFKAFPKIYY